MSAPLLSVRGLTTRFRTERGTVTAVDDVSFDVNAGETVAIVGESGSGKSVTALSILRLIPDPPGKIIGGIAPASRFASVTSVAGKSWRGAGAPPLRATVIAFTD